MQNIIIEIMNQYGYLGIGLLIAIENLFPPIPSEVILTFGGFMTTYAGLNVWIVILAATIGSTAGAIILYYIGRLIKPDLIKKLISEKAGKALNLKSTDLNKAIEWFDKRGNLTVFFCRFIPLVRSLISIPAGMTKMKFSAFLGYTIAGTAIWNTVLVWLGVFAGESWQSVVKYMGTYSAISLLIVGILAFIFTIVFYKRRIKKMKNESESTDEIAHLIYSKGDGEYEK